MGKYGGVTQGVICVANHAEISGYEFLAPRLQTTRGVLPLISFTLPGNIIHGGGIIPFLIFGIHRSSHQHVSFLSERGLHIPDEMEWLGGSSRRGPLLAHLWERPGTDHRVAATSTACAALRRVTEGVVQRIHGGVYCEL